VKKLFEESDRKRFKAGVSNAADKVQASIFDSGSVLDVDAADGKNKIKKRRKKEAGNGEKNTNRVQ